MRKEETPRPFSKRGRLEAKTACLDYTLALTAWLLPPKRYEFGPKPA